MRMIKFALLLILILGCSFLNAADVKKWTDNKGKIHYGDMIGHAQEAEVLEINDPVPEVTEGEKLMRIKNDLYFEELELKRKHKRLDQVQALAEKKNKKRKAILDQEQTLVLDYDRRACIKAKLKIKDIEDDLRDGYSAKRGMQLDKKRRQQQRRVDVYCE